MATGVLWANVAMNEEAGRFDVKLFTDIFTDLDQITATLPAGAAFRFVMVVDAHSSASAIMAMRGTKVAAARLSAEMQLPALLVIHGSNDRVVVPANGVEAAKQWAAQSGAQPDAPRTVRRGAHYPATITDYRIKGRLAVTFCKINGLGHAWSGGAAGHAYSDPKGTDASGMIWTFVAKQFASQSSQFFLK